MTTVTEHSHGMASYCVVLPFTLILGLWGGFILADKLAARHDREERETGVDGRN